MGLRIAQARLRDRQMPRVRLQVGVDRVELHVGEVVGLDRDARAASRSAWIWSSTSCAWACFASTLGSAEAVLTDAKATATKIAVRNVRIAGAFRLLELTTSSPSVRAHGAPGWGPGPSQVGHPSSLSGRRQRSTEPKTGHDPALRITNNRTCSENLLRSAPREDAFDERCGASRGRFHGLSAGRLGPGRARCGTPPACAPRPRRCARTTSRSRRGRTPPRWSSTPSRRSCGRRAARSRASLHGKRSSHGTAPRRASSSRSHATPCTSPSRSSPSSSAPSTSSPARPIPSRSCSARQSLDEALTGLDSLSRAAGENSRIIEQARASRKRLAALDARLAAREAELTQLAAAAAARARALAEAAETRERFVAGLRHQQGLNAARIASIEAQARTRGGADDWRSRPPSRPSRPPSSRQPLRQHLRSRSRRAARTITVSTTGYALRGRTATGLRTAPGVVAVDPSVIPLGTRLTIPGYGEAIAADTGGAVHGNVIDLWFPSTAQALRWGRRTVTITHPLRRELAGI